jgi:hypothetical protein
MAFQSTIQTAMGAGLPGELFDDGPRRAQPFTLRSDSAADNVFGRAFTVLSEGVAEAGKDGSQVFAGILINPKAAPLYGVSGDPYGASLTVPNEYIGELLSEGSIWVTLPAAANIGDAVYFTDATGVITTTAPGAAAPANSTLIKGAFVDRFTVTAAGLAVITLTNASRDPGEAAA